MNAELVQAYDAIAAEYDRQVQVDAWMRQVLWEHYLRCLPPGAHVLDVACGTGIDALFLAEQGFYVTGIDLSPAMIARLKIKAEQQNVAERIKAHVMDATELASWPSGCFDGIISAFAGLNTVPDLDAFATDAARLLQPGGRMILHILNRSSLWEWLSLVRRGRWAEAYHLGQQAERTFQIGDRAVRHRMMRPAETYQRFFAPHFVLYQCYSMGSLRPPPGKLWIPRSIVGILDQLERKINTHTPILNWGRFFVLDMRRR